MKTKIIKIGNSRGVRIPKTFIDESGLKNEVELEIDGDNIIIKPISRNRESWASAFRKMSKNNDDVLFDSETLQNQTNWNEEEWEW